MKTKTETILQCNAERHAKLQINFEMIPQPPLKSFTGDFHSPLTLQNKKAQQLHHLIQLNRNYIKKGI